MTPLYKILPAAEDAEIIRRCWGTMPVFDGYCEVLHLANLSIATGIGEVVLTALFITNESDDFNACKPSKICVRFRNVTHCEYDNGSPEKNDIKLAGVFTLPPADIVVVNFDGFQLACGSIQILSCVHAPLTPIEG